HKKRRTLGPLGHLTLDQARTMASHLMAEVIQQGVPSLAKPKMRNITLEQFLDEHYAPWARSELRGAAKIVARLQSAFADLLGLSLAELDTARIESWWRNRLTAVSAATGKPVQRAT